MRTASICVELALAISGAWFYWRAGGSVTASALAGQTRVTAAGLLVLTCGIAILVLDVTGILG